MWPYLQFPVDLVTFTEEIFNGKLHCFPSVYKTLWNIHDVVFSEKNYNGF